MIARNALRSQNQRAIAGEQAAARRRLQLFPDLVGAQHQGHEVAAFADGFASNAGVAVRRSLIVRRVEAVNADRACAQLGQLVERRAAHRSQPNDDDIGGIRHRRMIRDESVRVDPAASAIHKLGCHPERARCRRAESRRHLSGGFITLDVTRTCFYSSL